MQTSSNPRRSSRLTQAEDLPSQTAPQIGRKRPQEDIGLNPMAPKKRGRKVLFLRSVLPLRKLTATY